MKKINYKFLINFFIIYKYNNRISFIKVGGFLQKEKKQIVKVYTHLHAATDLGNIWSNEIITIFYALIEG